MASKVIRIKNERLKRISLETLPPMLVSEMLRYMASGNEEFSIWFQGWTVECKKED